MGDGSAQEKMAETAQNTADLVRRRPTETWLVLYSGLILTLDGLGITWNAKVVTGIQTIIGVGVTWWTTRSRARKQGP